MKVCRTELCLPLLPIPHHHSPLYSLCTRHRASQKLIKCTEVLPTLAFPFCLGFSSFCLSLIIPFNLSGLSINVSFSKSPSESPNLKRNTPSLHLYSPPSSLVSASLIAVMATGNMLIAFLIAYFLFPHKIVSCVRAGLCFSQ